MTIKHAFYCLLAAIHLTLVFLGAAGLSLPKTETGWDELLDVAREASGSDSTHGYYSPGVGEISRLVFILRDARGQTWTDSFEKTGVNETDLRMVEIVDALMKAENEPIRDKMARACADTMLAWHPTATSVTVRVEADDMPSMEEYRAGERVKWDTEYEITVHRGETDDQKQDQNDDQEEDEI